MTRKLEELNPNVDEFKVNTRIYYREQGGEVLTSLRAYATQVPVVYKGPTGCGKTTLASHLAYLLGAGFDELEKDYGKELSKKKLPKIGKTPLDVIKAKTEKFRDGKGFPLVTISGHEDLDSDELKGRPYVIGDLVYWLNGPAKLAAQYGGLLYFDEPAEARPDTRVAIHALSDHRRELAVEGLGTIVRGDQSFGFLMSYNDQYIDPRKRFKPSTAQRFIHLKIAYPTEQVEKEILLEITGIDEETAKRLIKIAQHTRVLATEKKIAEGASTRELVNASYLILAGENSRSAALVALANPITDKPEVIASIEDIIKGIFR